MRRLLRVIGYLLIAVIAIVLIGGYASWRAASQVPDFYAAAKRADPVRDAEQAEQLERQVLELRNTARQKGEWQTTWTAEQINAWLATELPAQFPHLLPEGFSDPRVQVTPDHLQWGCRFQKDKLDTILWLDVTLFLTDETNVLACQVRKVRAGLLPVPASQVTAEVERLARRADMPVKWDQAGGDPIALIRLPSQIADLGDRKVVFERLELRDGEIVFGGRSE